MSKPKDLKRKEKYHPHVKSTVDYFVKMFPNREVEILDVGTRDGYAVELLNEHGYNIIGTDIVPEYVKYAIDRKRDVILDDIMDTDIIEGIFDIIFSRHCIEHCFNTLLFLDNCAKLLKSKGNIFLTFPLETKEEFNNRKGNDHLVYFENKEAFRRIIKKSKFKEKWFSKSKHVGIKPYGKEVLFIGKLK